MAPLLASDSVKSIMRNETHQVSLGVFGVAIDIVPDLITFDCALQLLAGAILGFCKTNQVDCSQIYGNVVLFVLLQFKKKVMETEFADQPTVRFLAAESFQKIKSICIFASKQCDANVYLAMTRYRKNLSPKPVELRLYPQQFDTIIQHLATDILKLKLKHLIDVFVRVGVILKVLISPTIPCETFHSEHEYV
jgi:hypothetical protein